ncbi:MAG: trypsin-like peptidase domain-containing protein, partial [Rudanella sp.]|nr:trypsin-like peptidase domain-containing protein [Rudanella sp.]
MHSSLPTFRGLAMLLLLILAGFSVNAQVFTRKIDPADPATSKVARLPGGTLPATEFSSLDLASLHVEDALRKEQGRPLRIAQKQNASLNLLQVGRTVEADGERVTYYELRAPGAVAIGADFDQLQLAEGTRIFLYDAARTTLVGPITNTENTDNNHYLSDRLPGDRLIVEIREGPKASASVVNLSGIINEYTPYGPISATFRPTATCHNDLSCAPSYQYEADGVAMILMFDGVSSFFLCSGSMLNDTRQSFRSYFLTAFHCMDFNSDLTINANESASTASWSFYFKYQSPTCSPTQDDNIYVTINGATFRSASPNTDMTLLELNRQMPLSQSITYNGWDRRTTNYTGGLFGIHHPRGSVKKISFTTNTFYNGWNGTFPDSHYEMGLTSGSMEGGSSGSPLFNANRRVIGQLHGGSGTCPSSSVRSLYGRFDLSWFGNGANNTRLSNWLDASGTGATVTNAATPSLTGPGSFTGSATYTMNANNALTTWTVLGGEGVVSPVVGSGNRAELTALSNSSSLTIVFSINAGQSYPITYSQVISAGTPTANRAPQIPVGGIENQRVVLGVIYDFELPQFTDPDGDLLSYTATGLPTGLRFFNDPTGPYIFGQTSTPGVSTVVITATDPGGLAASAAFSLTILENRPPVATTAIAVSAPLGIMSTFALLSIISDPDGFPMSYTVTGAYPPGMGRSGSNITGRPTTAGSYTLTITGVDNGGLTATTPFIINVAPVANRAPVPLSPDLSFGTLRTGLNYRLNIAGIFTDPEGSTVAYGVIGLPGDFTLTGANSLTPAILGGRVDPATISVTVTGTDPQGAVGTTRLTMIFTRPASTSLSLLLPTYDCNTGTIIFNTAGGNGTSITYTAVGVQRSSPTAFFGTVEPGLRADPKPILITATQSGVTATYVFDLGAYCRNLTPILPPNPVQPPSPTGPLTMQQPTYNCNTGVIQFNTSAGDGSPITFSAVGVQLPSPTSTTGTVEPGLRADPKSVVITATQNGVSVSVTFNLGAYCSGSTPPIVPP